MKRTVFSTPLVTPLLKGLAIIYLKLCGWKIVSKDLPKPPVILIGAPHTSNWDFMLMLAGVLKLGLQVQWMGKDSLFRNGRRGLMTWLGGIPINRSLATDVVSQMAARFSQDPETILVMAPEGTRSKVDKWRTGFYYISLQARVPIAMIAIDGGNKELRMVGTFQPEGDIDEEMPRIQAYFSGIKGINPTLQ